MSLFKKPEEEIVAIFDIGNGSVGGALVKFSKRDHPVILYTHREPLTYMIHPTPKHLLGSMLKLLKSVATHLAKEGLIHVRTSPFGGHRLRDVHCVFASPWYISQTKIITEIKDTNFVISQETINALVQKEQEEFNAALKEGKYEQIFGPDTRLLEKRIINTRLNGYDIEEAVGKSAKELEVTLFNSFISQDIVAQVEETLHSSFAVRTIHHYSYALVSWLGSRTLVPDLHDYFFIDVSGETTDISLIIKDVIIETMSFPMGRSSLLRKVVKDLAVTPDVALSFLSMKYSGTLEKKFDEKINEVLKAVNVDWRDQLNLVLAAFQKRYTLPRATLLTADSDTSGFFSDALNQILPTELMLAQNTLAITFIGPDKVQPFIFQLPEVQHDAFIGIESIFLNELFKKEH
jgi:hypothetical protein